MPEPGNNILEVSNHHRKMPVPLVIYADFEAITEKVQSCQPSDLKSYTNKYQKHTGCSYRYKLVCCYNDKYSKPVKIYTGEDSSELFVKETLKETEYCWEIIESKFNKPLRMDKEEEQEFRATEMCPICGLKYTQTDVRVRVHCHITGKYRGSAHKDCNLKQHVDPKNFKLPVIFPNLRGYDSHLSCKRSAR